MLLRATLRLKGDARERLKGDAREEVQGSSHIALGLALLLFAVAIWRTAQIPRPIAYLMGLTCISYLMQGWVVGSEGFSPTHAILIVLAWVLTLAWMIWLVVVARRMRDSAALSPDR